VTLPAGRPRGAWSAGVRWRDGGWELRCSDCAVAGSSTCYWPLTDEFWNHGWGMTRCRACWRHRRAVTARRLRAEAWRRERDAAHCRAQRARQKLAVIAELRRAAAA
jgi:hypothetical protein